MPKQAWICDKCGSKWKDEESAISCENRHQPVKKAEALDYPEWTFDGDQRFPKRIKVTIDVEHKLDWAYATYVLDHIGPKAV